jgi:hypothetical protein
VGGGAGGGLVRYVSYRGQSVEGRVNLKVNRTPREHRQVYPDPSREDVGRHKLMVYWLEVGGKTPAKDEFEQLPNVPKIFAALATIDSLLLENRNVPKIFMESFTENNIKLLEIKAPQRGKMISRLLAYRESEWNIFVAFAQAKKSQDLPAPWKKVAADRVKNALNEGRPL